MASVSDAIANTIAASTSPSFVWSSSATTSTGTSRIRRSVRTLGPLRVNTSGLWWGGDGSAGAGRHDEPDRRELAQAEILPEHDEPGKGCNGRLHGHEYPEHVGGDAPQRLGFQRIGDRRAQQ